MKLMFSVDKNPLVPTMALYSSINAIVNMEDKHPLKHWSISFMCSIVLKSSKVFNNEPAGMD